MNIIERTQYSIDGGKTWGNTEQDARGLSASKALDELLGPDWAHHVMKAVRKHPDALIQAMRDMGALPFDPVHTAQHGYKDGYRDALEYAVNTGSICLHGLTYAVIPAEQHEKGKAAIGTMMLWARTNSGGVAASGARDWCARYDVNWEND